MSKIEIYSTALCPYCDAAKRFLTARGLSFTEVRVDLDPTAYQAMLRRAHGRRTVPQIFIADRHVGGYEDLIRLHRDGELDSWLTITP